jgi:alkanesulfonate monooxygenase SsuD/methylene tetrahydromethanopterin reductase-like flavin-dependent oxidoreductase (luciferase family)
MHFGLFSLMPQRDKSKAPRRIYAEMVEQVKLAEELGFEIAWFAEHHFSNYCVCPSPLGIIHYMAGLTSRIKLAPGVIVAPLYEPMRMLEDISVADILSDGRLVLGFGSGYQEYEFHKFGVNLDKSKAMFREYLGLVERFLAGDPVSYDGEFIQVPETYFSVRPLQARPDTYIAGLVHDRDLQKHMARKGYVPFVTTGWSTLDEIDASRQKIVEAYDAVGLDSADVPFAAQMYIHVTDSHEEALDAADHARYVRRIAMSMREQYAELDGCYLKEAPARGEPPLDVIAKNARLGSPEKIAEQLVADIRRLKPTHLSCFMAFGGLSQARIMKSMERFGAEVLPMVEKELGDLSKLGAPVPSAPALAAE